jgi:hypothetical protein
MIESISVIQKAKNLSFSHVKVIKIFRESGCFQKEHGYVHGWRKPGSNNKLYVTLKRIMFQFKQILEPTLRLLNLK